MQFTPSAANTDFAGSLSISSNAEQAPHILPLAGRGVAFEVPVLTWRPAVAEIAFGIVPAGSLSTVQTVMLQNNGPGGASIALINAVGADAASFVVETGAVDPTACSSGRIIYQGESCRVDLLFAPGSSGSRASSLQVVSSGSAPPQLTLSGTGMGGPTPALILSPASLSFEDTQVGSRSQPIDVLIHSSGAGPLRVMNVSATGAFVIQSGRCPALPFTLQAGASCALALAFAPLSDGPATGTLTVMTDATPSTQAVAMSGNAAQRADLSSGGCSISDGGSATDPTLWLLVVLAIAVLVWRQRTANRNGDPR